jgi:hypothetical protein
MTEPIVLWDGNLSFLAFRLESEFAFYLLDWQSSEKCSKNVAKQTTDGNNVKKLNKYPNIEIQNIKPPAVTCDNNPYISWQFHLLALNNPNEFWY